MAVSLSRRSKGGRAYGLIVDPRHRIDLPGTAAEGPLGAWRPGTLSLGPCILEIFHLGISGSETLKSESWTVGQFGGAHGPYATVPTLEEV